MEENNANDHELLMLHDKQLMLHESKLSELGSKLDVEMKYIRGQNDRILDQIIARNETSATREYELKKDAQKNFWKIAGVIIGAIFGGGGILYTLLDQLIK